MNNHIVTPFSRFENLSAMMHMLEPMGVEWHLLLDDNGVARLNPQHDWIHCYYFPSVQPFWRAWAQHLNAFIKMAPLVDGDRYMILNDDDFLEPGFFAKTDEHNGEVLVVSMKRGQHSPPGGHGHGTDTLVACPENMLVGRVGCEQMLVSGRLLPTVHFNDSITADGEAIVDMSKRAAIEYAPEAFVFFNYLEPGRWDK